MSETSKQPWEMTSDEYERSLQGATYGDWYTTPEGSFVRMAGGGGLGSPRVLAVNVHGEFVGWYDHSELSLCAKDKETRETAINLAAFQWASDVASQIATLRSDNERILLGHGLRLRFLRSLGKGEITPDRYQALLDNGTILSDEDFDRATDIIAEMDKVKDTKIVVDENMGHRYILREASLAGEPIPAHVRDEYPDMFCDMCGSLRADCRDQTFLKLSRDNS